MREQNVIKFINRALNDDHLYSDEEIIYMKKELSNLKEQLKISKKLTSKGFEN